MRKVTMISLVAILALSAVLTGTILAQDDGTATESTAWLGISFVETSEGIVVRRVVTGSPAAAGGLLIGDVLVSIDGAAVESAEGLLEIVASHAPGDTVAIVVLRSGAERTLEVELGTTPAELRRNYLGPYISANVDPLVLAEMVLHVELDAVDGGYQVLAGRMRMASDLEVGDVITAVNGTPVSEVDWVALVTELAQSDDATLTLTVLRDGEELAIDSALFGGFFQRGMMDCAGGFCQGMMERFGGSRGDRFRGHGGFRGNMPPVAPGAGTSGMGMGMAAPVESGTPA